MEKYYKIVNRSDQEADILIYGEIGDSWFEESVTANQFRNDIADLEKKNSRINVRINSVGGSVWDGLAIYNTLKSSSADIHTYNDGIALSMAALILMSGKTVHAASNSITMLHAPMVGVYGNTKEFQKTISVLDKVENSLIDMIVARTSHDATHIKATWFDGEDHWFSAAEAKEFGFVDEIVGEKLKVSDKVKNLDYNEIRARFDELIKPVVQKKQNGLIQWMNNLFPHSETQELPQDDMDIKLLRDAFGMDDSATEDQVLAQITALKTEKAVLEQQLRDTASSLEAEASQHAATASELEELKKAPAAQSAVAAVDTDAVDTSPKAANDFFEAFASCKEVLSR